MMNMETCEVMMDINNEQFGKLMDPLKTEEPDVYDGRAEFLNDALHHFNGTDVHLFENEIKQEEEEVGNDLNYCYSSDAPSTRNGGQGFDENATFAKTKRLWQCNTCERTLRTERALSNHEKTHTAGDTYKCDWCERTFSSRRHQSRHSRLCREDDAGRIEIYHKCNICKNSYNNPKLHKLTHLDEVIEKVTSYAANSCALCMETVQNLLPKVLVEVEAIKRTSVRLLKESECANFDALITKLELHESKEDARACELYCNIFKNCGVYEVYVCDICNKKCMNEADLCSHKSTHSLIACTKQQTDGTGLEEFYGTFRDINVEWLTASDAVIKVEKVCGKLKKESVPVESESSRSDDENRQLLVASEVSEEDSSECNKVACAVCAKTFHKKYMKTHMLIHSDKKPFRCNTCGERCITRARLQAHRLKHSDERNHTCNFCGKTYKAKYMLKRHVLVHHSDERPFPCDVCGKSFPTRCNLRLHQEIHTDRRDFVCEVCDKAFKVKRNLAGHIREVHLNKLHPPKEKKISSYYFKKTECGICFKMFHVNYIDIHMKVHSEDKPFYCDICSKGYNSAKQMQLHKLTHSEDRKFVCTYCGKAYKTKYVLYVHTMFNHSEDRPFPCEVCGKGFPTKGTRNTHQKIHTATKDFVCNMCGKAFSIKKMLRNHMKTHFVKAKPTAKPRSLQRQNRIFECNLCDKIYNFYGSLAYHKKSVHCDMNHKCEFCGKAFVYPVGLEKHLRIHTGEKSHLCEECGKSFNTYTSFVMHRKSHSKQGLKEPVRPEAAGDEKQDDETASDTHLPIKAASYECYICKKKFLLASILIGHLKDVHMDEIVNKANRNDCAGKGGHRDVQDVDFEELIAKSDKSQMEVCLVREGKEETA